MKLQDQLILCHFNEKVLSLWADLYNKNNIEVSFLMQLFTEKLNSRGKKIFFSFETDNLIKNVFLKNLSDTNKEEVPFNKEAVLLYDLFHKDKIESITFFDSFNPFWDTDVYDNMLQIHNEYSADYTFCENTPEGIAPVLFSSSIFDAYKLLFSKENDSYTETELKAALQSMPFSFKQYLEKNLNQYHVEIHFEFPDIRMLRLDFSCSTLRSFHMCNSFVKKLKVQSQLSTPYKNLKEIIQSNPEIIHEQPSYIEIEPYSGCSYQCTFCPRTITDKAPIHKLALSDFITIDNFCKTLYGDTVITLGGNGEPLEHPEIIQILEFLLQSPHVRYTILETNGYFLEKIHELRNNLYFEKLRIVININSLEQYEKIHGTDKESREKVFNNLISWSQILKGTNTDFLKNTYIQMLKIIDNETEVDEVYNLSETHGFTFLLQKYNSYNGQMEEKRVSDMTPLERSFCWHLRRDLFIRADGSISFCKQDILNKKPRGNIRTNNISIMVENQKKDWIDNYHEKYPSEPACIKCDEYFTFNL